MWKWSLLVLIVSSSAVAANGTKVVERTGRVEWIRCGEKGKPICLVDIANMTGDDFICDLIGREWHVDYASLDASTPLGEVHLNLLTRAQEQNREVTLTVMQRNCALYGLAPTLEKVAVGDVLQ